MSSLLDAIGGGLTAATDVAAGKQRGEMQGSQLLRAIGMQQAQMGHLNAETASNNARADWYKSRVPTEEGTQNLRESLISAGNDPNDVDAAIAASRSGDHSGIKSLFAAAPKGPAPRILRTPTGYVSVTPGDEDPAAPVLGPDGKPVMPIIAPPRSSTRAPNPEP